MKKKKIIPFINAENEYPENIIKLADEYACKGADELFIYNYTGDEASRDEFLSTARVIEKQIDIPFMIGMYVERFEDAKKHFIPEHTNLCLEMHFCRNRK